MQNNNNANYKSTSSPMDEDTQRHMASHGGKASHEKGGAHQFTSEGAREAGRRDGQSRENQPGRSGGNQGDNNQ